MPLPARLAGLALVLFALPAPARAQRGVSDEAIRAAVDQGVKYLLSRAEKGSWSGGGLVNVGKDALALYTLHKAGIAKDHEAFGLAYRRLLSAVPDRTYDAAATILCLEAVDGVGQRLRLEELAALLISWQKDGDWGYPAGRDLSNTQYAALGLWAAERARVPIPDRIWVALAEALPAYVNSDGGFRYKPKEGATTGSMTAAGLTTLVLAETFAPGLRGVDGKTRRLISKSKKSAERWLADEFRIDANPGSKDWHLYWLYSLERLGALTGETRFGDHLWYDEGARYLIERQRPDGSWQMSVQGTCFSMLFLLQATRPRSGPGTKAADAYGTQDDEEAPIRIIAKGDTPLSLWVVGWNEDALEGLVWPGEEGRGPRVSRLEYLANGEVIQTVRASATEPAGDERFAVRHTFQMPGSYSIRVRAHCLGFRRGEGGQAVAGEARVVESPAFDVPVAGAYPPWLRAQSGDPLYNRMPTRGVTLTSSSQWRGEGEVPARRFGHELAVDRRLATPWIASPDDVRPRLTLALREPVEADVLLFSPAWLPGKALDLLGHAGALEVSVNGEKPTRIELFDERRRKGRLELRRAMKVSRIDVSLVDLVPGEETAAVGLAEVELQLSRERKEDR